MRKTYIALTLFAAVASLVGAGLWVWVASSSASSALPTAVTWNVVAAMLWLRGFLPRPQKEI